MNSRLILGLIGLVAISPCIFGQMILDYFQIEVDGEKSSSGMVLNTVVVVLGLLGLAMIILSLSGGTPRAVLDETRSRSVPKHFSEALSVLCILLAVGGGVVAINNEGQISVTGLVVCVLGVAGWVGFAILSKPTLRELVKGSIHHALSTGRCCRDRSTYREWCRYQRARRNHLRIAIALDVSFRNPGRSGETAGRIY